MLWTEATIKDWNWRSRVWKALGGLPTTSLERWWLSTNHSLGLYQAEALQMQSLLSTSCRRNIFTVGRLIWPLCSQRRCLTEFRKRSGGQWESLFFRKGLWTLFLECTRMCRAVYGLVRVSVTTFRRRSVYTRFQLCSVHSSSTSCLMLCLVDGKVPAVCLYKEIVDALDRDTYKRLNCGNRLWTSLRVLHTVS